MATLCASMATLCAGMATLCASMATIGAGMATSTRTADFAPLKLLALPASKGTNSVWLRGAGPVYNPGPKLCELSIHGFTAPLDPHMHGQGRPHLHSASVSRCGWHRKCLWLRLLPWSIWLCALSLAGAVSAESVDLHLRIAWGGGAARQWQGTLSVESGIFSQLQYLGLDADENATIYLDYKERDVVQIRERAPRDYDGFDVHVVGSSTSVLRLELAPTDHGEETQKIEVTLAELVSGYRHANLDAQNNQLLMQRVSGDQLRAQFDRTSLVFSPGEKFELRITPHQLGLDDLTNLRCEIQLFAARQDKVLWQQSEDVALDEVGRPKSLGPINVPLPETEGVCELVIALHRKRFRAPFVRSKPLVQRVVQLVVVADKAPVVTPAAWKLVETLDPNHASWMEWLTRVPKLPLLPDFRQEPLGNGKSKGLRHLEQDLVELAPGGWQAYPLSVSEVGKPHVLEVEYPSDLPQTLGISIVEPNAMGKVIPLGLDSGLDVPESSWRDRPKMLRHKLIFWPRTATPLVLLTNRRDNQSATFGMLRVYAGPSSIPGPEKEAEPDEGKSQEAGSGTLPSASAGATPRLLAAYFDRPLFPENFSARESADAASGRSLKDWLTFYEGGCRLVEYLQYVGYNGAIVSVAYQGGTIYPSQWLTPTPKFDNGIVFASAQDPMQKDVLELLFRLFDRAGLTLVPAVHFSSTLRELEELMREHPEAREGIVLVDQQGKSWIEGGYGITHGAAPHYNPLDRRVQMAMRRVLNEISDRYGTHASFGGLSLQLGPDTYALFPGEQWGRDAATVKRFEQESAVAALPASAVAAAWPRERVRTWLNWRAKAIRQFQRELLDDLQQRRADGRLYLLTGDLFTNPSVQAMLRPTLPNRLRVDEALLQMGLNTQLYTDQRDLVLLRPDRIAPRQPLTTQAVNINLSGNAAADHTFGDISPGGVLFYHEQLSLSLPSFDEKSPFGSENTRTVLFSHVTPAAEFNRQRFVHHLAVRDAPCMVDGGWMLPLGQEESLTELFRTLKLLPAVPFETVKPENNSLPTQPLVVRTRVHQGKTYVYVVNDAPWPVSAEIDLRCAEPFQIRGLGRPGTTTPKWMDGQLTWHVDLEPYDVVAAEMSSEQVTVVTWRVPPDRTTFAHLRQLVDEMDDRITMLERPEPISVLSNAGFEAAPDRLPGWIHAQKAGITIAPDANEHYEGTQSLKMTNDGQPGQVAWIRSDPIDPPKTGRIAVIVRLKTDDPNKQPQLNLAIDLKYLNGMTYYMPFSVGTGAKEPLRADWGEKPFVMLIPDLPINELANIRIGFDLMAAGTVWIDDVHVYDCWFPKNERDDLTLMRVLATRSLNQGNLTDCQRILAGYWPQFLREYVSMRVPEVAQLPADTPRGAGAFPPPQPKEGDEKPSMFDKVRQFPTKVFPFRLR